VSIYHGTPAGQRHAAFAASVGLAAGAFLRPADAFAGRAPRDVQGRQVRWCEKCGSLVVRSSAPNGAVAFWSLEVNAGIRHLISISLRMDV
jgi:hypothetical protein